MRSSKVSVIQYEDEEPAKVEEVNIFIIVCVINSTNFVSSFPFNKFFWRANPRLTHHYTLRARRRTVRPAR